MTTPATADWALPQPGGPDPGSEGIWRRIVAWWSEFSLQTKLLAIATLVVSLVMTGITFLALNGIQRDAVMNDTRYARDLGLLLAGNVTELVVQEQDRELANVAEKFWRSSRSVRYIFFADPEGVVYLGIPISGSAAGGEGDLRLNRRLELPDELRRRPQNPLVRQHLTPQGRVTDVFVPLIRNGRYYGVLGLGVNPNETALASAALTREVTVAVFISIWVLVILGAVFNALTITRPVKELLRGAIDLPRQLSGPHRHAGRWRTGGAAQRLQRDGLPARGLRRGQYRGADGGSGEAAVVDRHHGGRRNSSG